MNIHSTHHLSSFFVICYCYLSIASILSLFSLFLALFLSLISTCPHPFSFIHLWIWVRQISFFWIRVVSSVCMCVYMYMLCISDAYTTDVITDTRTFPTMSFKQLTDWKKIRVLQKYENAIGEICAMEFPPIWEGLFIYSHMANYSKYLENWFFLSKLW